MNKKFFFWIIVLLIPVLLVPLFNLSSLLNSKSKKETVPFLSYFLPGKVDDDNSSYQVFLRFRFEDKMELKQKQKSKTEQKVDSNEEISQDQVVELDSAEYKTDIDNNDEELANELLIN